MEKREPFYTVGGNANWCSHYGKQYEAFLNTKNRTIMWYSNFTSGYISGKDENTNLKRYDLPSVHSNTIYNRQDMEATQVAISRWLD